MVTNHFSIRVHGRSAARPSAGTVFLSAKANKRPQALGLRLESVGEPGQRLTPIREFNSCNGLNSNL